MGPVVEQSSGVIGHAYANWVAGGWCMPPMAANALVMFALGVHVMLKQNRRGGGAIKEKVWRRWIDHPAERRGPVGDIINYVEQGTTLEESAGLFNEVRAKEIAPFDRDLRVMSICASAAPLIGLLGTVTGILTLFAALAHGSGGEKTMKLIAGGVSEALVATQTGLMFALPGLIYHHTLMRTHERYKGFISRMETVYAQRIYKATHATAMAGRS